MNNSILELKHVMIDTETLGLTPGSVVRTVSLVEFEPHTGKTGRKQTWVINLQDSIKAGFRIEAGTLKWWMMKSEEARKAFVSSPENEISLVSFVSEFEQWFKQYGDKVALWGLQIDFDPAMIRPYLAYYHMFIMREDSYNLPWNRKCMVDVRPFMEAYRCIHPEQQTVHTSMDDCMMQIDAVAEIFRSLEKAVVPDDKQSNLLQHVIGLPINLLQFNGIAVAGAESEINL